ncbi:hypothetical protein JMJ58_15835 [Haloterrigena salifodinae]|uniref:Uncharacterized protein n=1 Tax=Haloterrigena salifodinae TaxID=2675099 RepID=A0A8T8DY16_9EURY|nr:hypothetical protein [Haloterrigena salifodinae]QRV14395.1 hypothetical protein JMJ58_15835 [Haloterrigena salifodinae]
MTDGHPRRAFLGIAGTGVAASLAGCSQLEALTQSDDGSSDAVTVAVSPDREELKRLNEEIQTAVQSGNMTQQEAQQRAMKEQRNLTEEAATEFEDSADDSDISVEESKPEYGLLRVTGSDEAIMSALREGEISGIYPGDQYDAFVQQQQQQAQQREMLRRQQEEQQNDSAENESDAGNETDAGTDTDGSDDGNQTAENESDAGNETDE